MANGASFPLKALQVFWRRYTRFNRAPFERRAVWNVDCEHAGPFRSGTVMARSDQIAQGFIGKGRN